ncbi:rod shape-determining protein MreC [Parasediminibacterium sp. JCM 36343]|uniref:rod shape-determining protein MreC n=1 Tax=Parasediminibacterium sp. JCM 36343 TaxID=3374279 RepID=UPI00397B888E
MKNIILFIRNYFTLICFVALQVTCILMLNKSSKTHEAFFSFYGNEFVSNVNKLHNNIFVYFNLREVNKQLADENSRLKYQAIVNQIVPDNTHKIVIDSTLKDTSGRYRKYTFFPAAVVGNSTTLQNNFITLERGSLQGVQLGMSVIAPQGVVGTVLYVSENFSIVMSILNRSSRVSAMLKKDNNAGSIEWSGENPLLLTLKNIPKSVKVNIGDTVVTSSYSANFPSNIMVGTIAAKTADQSSNFYTLKVNASTSFGSLQYVYLVKNVRYEEQKALETKVQKTND